jgi:undecaprenyl-diphosphatase
MVIAAAGLTFGFCDQFSNIIKHAVGRIRPLKDEFMLSQGLHILENGGGYSFFSAHAANAFGLACSTFFGMRGCLKSRPCWLKAYGIWMFFWAAIVSISRIFVGKHYLGDVLVGTLVGVLAGYFFGWLAARIAAKK